MQRRDFLANASALVSGAAMTSFPPGATVARSSMRAQSRSSLRVSGTRLND
jgi:hypothetical protein